MKQETEQGWTADWIRFGWNPVVPYLRKSFKVDGRVVKATVRATALGIYELMFNGRRIGEDVFQPGWTDYSKRVYYQEYDITELVETGENVLGSMVAPGWYAGFIGPFEDKGFYGREAWFSCELVLTYSDGSTETLLSDATWVGHAGPVLRADLLMGESYDARLEVAGWAERELRPDTSNQLFTPRSEWGRVLVKEEPVEALIERYPGTPVRQVEVLPAQTVHPLPNGDYIFDLGQNMVGAARLRVNVPQGTELVLRHGEMLQEDGSLYTANLRAAEAVDRYTAKGSENEVWQPRFTFHGFRYVQVSGLPEVPDLGTVSGVVLSSVHQASSYFECSNAKVNQLFSNINWGFKGNYLDIPTDCPQRDERLGWTGDTQIFIKSACFLADVRRFFDKWLQDLHDAQREDGAYPDVAPFLGRLSHGRAAWSDAGIICPYILWKMYGDIDYASKWWPEMCRYMEYLFTEDNRHNSVDAESFGDWLNVDSETPNEFIGQAYRLYNCRLMKEMAGALGLADEVLRFSALEQQAQAVFEKRFITESGGLKIKTQTAFALVVAMELMDDAFIQRTADELSETLAANNNYLATGFVGISYLCPALSRSGHHEQAVSLLLNEEYPSWLYEVNNGATTIWERWDSWSHEHGFGDVSMNSFNHYAFGSVCEWMFESLAGIQAVEPGFNTIMLAPGYTERLDYVRAGYASPAGPVSIHWKRSGATYVVNVEIPGHVDAFLRTPSGDTVPARTGEYRFELEKIPVDAAVLSRVCTGSN